MNKYFAADAPEEVVKTLIRKSDTWFEGVNRTNYIEKIERSWRAYHGYYYDNGHTVSLGGEQGEIVNMAVNHYRNLAKHILVMVTSTRPSFKCRAINTDKKSMIQAKLGDGLLDYYMREKRLERVLKDAVEYAIVLGSGYLKLEWNSTKGEIFDYIEPDPSSIFETDDDGVPLDKDGKVIEPLPIYEGDAEFSLLSPYDVVFDSTKERYDDNIWVLCRTFVNKFDIAAKYPELYEQITEIRSKSKLERRTSRVVQNDESETDDIPVYEFFHKRTESLPNGRYVLYLNQDIVLEDTMMPYRSLPIYRISPSNILGTPYGYTDMFDLMPLQEMLNSLYSTATTNINAFGVQNILNPRGNDVSLEQVAEGMNFIEYNAQMGKPEALQLVQTSPEVYQMISLIEKTMETLSGVNSVARGNPEQSLRSGTALALVQSQALQYVSGLQQSYIQLLEDVGTGLINLLKDFANVPRIAAISGINNRTEMKEFKSDDINSINRVVVDVGNALMQSTAGRAQIAENLLQMGLIETPETYLSVLSTGNLDFMTDSKTDEMVLIKSENEAMLNGEEVIGLFSDMHALHIKEHRTLLNDYMLRRDPELVQAVLDHIQEHINLLQTTDPNILTITNQQPLSPPGGTPANMQNPQVPTNAPVNSEVMDPNMQAAPANMPGMPTPAGVDEGILPPQPTSPNDIIGGNV
jgi:hypothetical protein